MAQNKSLTLPSRDAQTSMSSCLPLQHPSSTDVCSKMAPKSFEDGASRLIGSTTRRREPGDAIAWADGADVRWHSTKLAATQSFGVCVEFGSVDGLFQDPERPRSFWRALLRLETRFSHTLHIRYDFRRCLLAAGSPSNLQCCVNFSTSGSLTTS